MPSEAKKPLNKRLILVMLFGGAAIAFSLLKIIFPKESCGCGSEAKTYVGSMNRAQQAYFLEKGSFTNSIAPYSEIPLETNKYKYFSRVENKISTPNYEIFMVSNLSQAKKDDLQNYYGLAWATKSRNEKNSTQSEPINMSILCKASNTDATITSEPKVKFSKDFKQAFCPKGMEL